MAGKPRKDKVERAAAAAAAAAVRASQDNVVKLAWASDDTDEDGEELREEIIAGLEQIHEEAGDVSWELYADTPADKAGQIRKLATSELRRLRDECLSYGPGEYHVIARGPDGTFVKKSRYNIRISHFARPATPPTNTPSIDPIALLQQLDDRQEKRRIAARAEREQTIKFWAPILAPLGVELAKGLFGRSGGDSIKDLVGALVGVKDLIGGGKTSEVETLLKGIELARDMAPENTKGSTWQDVLLNGLRELRPLAETITNRKLGVAPPAPAQPVQFQTAPAQLAAPAGNGVSPPTSVTATGAAGEDPMWPIIEPLLQRLAAELEEYAGNGAEATLAAEALLAKVPRLIASQIQPQQMKEWLTQGNWWELAVKFRPSLAPYQGFCDDVRLTLLQVFEEQLNPPADKDDEEAAAS